MNPFDQAWALLKAPLISGSFETDEGHFPRLRGKFMDPKTGEIMDAGVYVQDQDEYTAYIGNEKDYAGADPSVDAFPRSEQTTFHSPNATTARTGNVSTRPEFRKRGYAKALYDMMAYYLANSHGKKLGRHHIQSPGGKAIWDDVIASRHWPVREDLE